MWGIQSKLWIKKAFTFEKIEPKSRKTDGFMAFVAAFIVSDRLEPYQQQRPRNLGVYTYGIKQHRAVKYWPGAALFSKKLLTYTH